MNEKQSVPQAYLAAIVESSEDAILSKDTDGIIQSANASAERIFGYSPAELVGKSVRILIPPELQAEEDEILARVCRGERVDHFETVRITKDKRRIDISLTISPVRDASGRVIGASKIARDITEHKRLERELAAQQERLRVTLASIGDAVIACDLDGRVTYLNPSAAAMTGWPASEAAGRGLHEVFRIFDERTRAPVQNPAGLVMRSGNVVGLANHTVLVHRDGTISGLQFVRRSGSFTFDLQAQGAVEAAARAGSFGPLPPGYGPDVLPVSFFFSPRSLR